MRWRRSGELVDEHERFLDEVKEGIARKILPMTDGFQNFCQEVGLDNVCDSPIFGTHGRNWNHYNLDELDKAIIYRSFDGSTFSVGCTQFPRYAQTFGEVGVPTFATDLGDVVLEEVRYNNQIRQMEVRFISTKGKLSEWVTLAKFRGFNPKLIGIATYCDDAEYGLHRVQIVPPEKELLALKPKRLTLRQRILRWMFGYY